MGNTRHINFVFANNWQGRQGSELFAYLNEQVQNRDIIFGSEVEAQMSGSSIPASKNPVYAAKVDGQVMVNQANVLMSRYGSTFHIEFAGENERTYFCQETGAAFDNIQYGNIMMVSNRLKRIDTGSVFIFGVFAHRSGGEHSASSRVLQFAVVEKGGDRFIFAHFHGTWIRGNTKGDCTERDEQSAGVLRALQELRTKYQCERIILGGDFNLDITTNALATLEQGLLDMPFRNMVRENGFTGTRTPHYRNYHDLEHSNFADYVLVSPLVTTESLTLGADRASDHHSLEGAVR